MIYRDFVIVFRQARLNQLRTISKHTHTHIFLRVLNTIQIHNLYIEREIERAQYRKATVSNIYQMDSGSYFR